MIHIKEPEKNIPVIEEYDVVVLGGGPSGVSAAISSARNGAKTALIERYGYTGGQATGGLVILIVGLTDGENQIIKGICQEIIDDLFKINAAEKIGNHVLFNPEPMKLIFDEKIIKSGVVPYYHSFAAETIIENKEIKAIITEGKSGRQAIKAKVFVDATGDADLAKYCDIPYEIKPKSDLKPVTLGYRVGGVDIKMFQQNKKQVLELIESLNISTKMGGWMRTLNPNEIWLNIAHVENIDSTDSQDLTKAEIEARVKINKLLELFKQNVPGFENAYIIDTAQQIGVRDSRRIKGLYCFEEKDLSSEFEDTIARAPNYTEKGNKSVEIPYRCMITDEIKNVIFCGRSISFEHEFQDMFREIPCCMATGQAAGTAAALAVEEKHFVQDVNIRVLRERLLEHGAVLSSFEKNLG